MAEARDELIMEMKTELDEKSKEEAMERIVSALEGIGVAEIGHHMWEKVIDEGGAMQMLKTKLSTVFGSADIGNEVAEQIDEAGRNTLFSMDSLESFSKRMVTLGLTTAEGLRPLITTFSDLANGDEASFNALGNAYSRLAITGKANSMVLRQFGEANGDIIMQLEKMYGLHGKNAAATLRKIADDGNITKEVIDKAMNELTTGTGKYAGANDRIMKDMVGEIHTFGAEATNIAEGIGTAMAPNIAAFLDYGVQFLRWYQDADKGLNVVKIGFALLTGVMTGFFVKSIASALGFNLSVIASTIAERGLMGAIMGATEAMMAFDVASGGIPLIIGALATGATLLITYWSQVKDWFVDFWNWMVQKAEDMANFMHKLLPNSPLFDGALAGEIDTLKIKKDQTAEDEKGLASQNKENLAIKEKNNLLSSTTNIMKKVNYVTMNVAFNNSNESSKKQAERLLSTGMA